MRKIMLIMVVLFSYQNIYAERFINIQVLDKGVIGMVRHRSPLICDMDRDGNYEIWLSRYYGENPVNFFIYTYEHIPEDSFVWVHTIYDKGALLNAMGDFDGDGLYELIISNQDSDKIFIMEQPDSYSYCEDITWASDTGWLSGTRYIGVSKFMRDSVDVIYGLGIPWLSDPTTAYGMFYMSCIGDNEYEIRDTFEWDRYASTSMDVGDLDGDSLCDIIAWMGSSTVIFEATDERQDSFEIVGGWGNISNYYPDIMIIGPDLDHDGHNEVLSASVIATVDAHYFHAMMEDEDGDGVYDTIWTRDTWAPPGSWIVWGGDIDYGDVDGDGNNEVVISGGRGIEVWKWDGSDNGFELIWSYLIDDYTLTRSHVRCYDFNGNGYDEIVMAVDGEDTACTYIFEDSVITAVIDSAVAYEGMGIEEEGIDGDDYVVIYFSNRTNIPDITSQNINNLLKLSSSHSWLDGIGIIRGGQWSSDSSKLIIYLSDIGDIPTLTIGDTIYPNRLELKSYDNITPVKGTTILTGTFDPPDWVENNNTSDNQENRIIIFPIKGGINIRNYTGDITIYDVSGRIIKTVHITTTNQTIPLNRGIYFIKVGDKIKKVNVVR